MIEPMALEDLSSLKDDMNAFIVGHGMQRFHAYVSDEMNSVLWESAGNPDSWKDFVELAKASGVAFLTSSEDALEKEDLEFLIERLQNSTSLDDEMEEARLLRQHVGKLGFIQLGFSYQGMMFLWEISTAWYDRYQVLLESSDEFSSIILDERDRYDDDEK
jgi:hypothetical protein